MSTTLDSTAGPNARSGVLAPAAGVPAAIEQAMRRTGAHYYRALNLPMDTYREQADRAAVLADACAERAGCWAALARWAASADGAVPWPLLAAVTSARRREDDAARFWRDTASYWRRASAGADPRDLDAQDLDLPEAGDARGGRWVA